MALEGLLRRLGIIGEERPDSPPRSATRPSPAGRLQEAVSAEASSADFDKRLNKLPPQKRLSAAVGFTGQEGLEAMELPSEYRAFALYVPKDSADAARAIVNSYGAECSSHFHGDNEDEYSCIEGVVPSQNNLHHIFSKLMESSICGKFFVSEGSVTALRAKGGSVMPLLRVPRFTMPEQEKLADLQVSSVGKDGTLKTFAPRVKLPEAKDFTPSDDTSPASLELAETESPKYLPVEGAACTYLIVSTESLGVTADDPNLVKLVRELKGTARSHRTYFSRQNGDLVIVCDDPSKAAGKVTGVATKLHRGLPTTSVHLGCGAVKNAGSDSFSIDGFPDINARFGRDEDLGASVYLSREVHSLLTDPENRQSTLARVECAKVPSRPDVMRLESFRYIPSLYAGGPAEYVGDTATLQKIINALQGAEAKLIIVEGDPGVGKSRNMAEANTNVPVAHSYVFSDTDSSSPYATLSFLRDRVTEKGEKGESKGRIDSLQSEVEALLSPDGERSPDQIRAEILTEWKESNIGGTPQILDDFHLADPNSLTELFKLMRGYMWETDGKIVVGVRSEEHKQPHLLRQLEQDVTKQFGLNSVLRVRVNAGDFSKDNGDHDYVRTYRWFREPCRRNISLGDWYRSVVPVAEGNPLALNEILDTLLENPEANFVSGPATIELTETGRRVVEELKITLATRTGGNLECVQTDKLRKLRDENPDAFAVLQCLALKGGEFTLQAIDTIAHDVLGLLKDPAKVNELKNLLVRREYIVAAGGDQTTSAVDKKFRLKNESLRSVAIATIDRAKGGELSGKILAAFQSDDPENRFRVATYRAQAGEEAPGSESGEFWEDYAQIADACFAGAEGRRLTGRVYSYAMSVINLPASQAALYDLAKKEVRVLDEPLHALVVNALMRLADAAVCTGAFEDLKRAARAIEQIYGKNPLAIGNERIRRIRELLFEAAYTQADGEEMLRLWELLHDQGGLQKGAFMESAQKAIAEMRLAYRRNDFAGVRGIYREHEKCLENADDLTMGFEGERMAEVRVPFELWRYQITNEASNDPSCLRADEDAYMHSDMLSPAQRQALEQIYNKLMHFLNLANSHPAHFGKYSMLSLVEQQAHMQALFGDHKSAAANFGETARLADQLGVPRQASVAAKNQGDVLVLNATTVRHATAENPIGRVIERRAYLPEVLKNAYEAYLRSKQYADQVQGKDWQQLASRGQLMRVVAKMCISRETEIGRADANRKRQISLQLLPYLREAMMCFYDINKEWASKARDPYFQYYIQGSVGDVLGTVSQLGLDIGKFGIPGLSWETLFDKSAHPFMYDDATRLARDYSGSVVDSGCVHDMVQGRAESLAQGRPMPAWDPVKSGIGEVVQKLGSMDRTDELRAKLLNQAA